MTQCKKYYDINEADFFDSPCTTCTTWQTTEHKNLQSHLHIILMTHII